MGGILLIGMNQHVTICCCLCLSSVAILWTVCSLSVFIYANEPLKTVPGVPTAVF